MPDEKTACRDRHGFRGFRVEVLERTILGRRVGMTDETTLWISGHLAEKIRAHGAETYPHECCGALLGRDSSEIGGRDPEAEESTPGREILALFPLVNRRDDSPRNRFSVTSEDVMA